MDNSLQTSLHPGPLINDVLFLNEQHRASALFNGYITDSQLQIRRCDGGLWQHTPIPDRVAHYIQLAGFEGILQCGYVQIDHALITALVERWRPETHTFHFSVGEATVTLQDVEVLWGLRIDGEPVIGADINRSVDEWTSMCQHLLGFIPPTGAIKGGRIKVGCLAHALDVSLTSDAPDEACIQRARIYIMLLFGGLLFSDKSGGAMPLIYLPMLEDLKVTQLYSWGSAVLASLYRNLCEAASPTAGEIAGPLVLLQVNMMSSIFIIMFTQMLHVVILCSFKFTDLGLGEDTRHSTCETEAN